MHRGADPGAAGPPRWFWYQKLLCFVFISTFFPFVGGALVGVTRELAQDQQDTEQRGGA